MTEIFLTKTDADQLGHDFFFQWLKSRKIVSTFRPISTITSIYFKQFKKKFNLHLKWIKRKLKQLNSVGTDTGQFIFVLLNDVIKKMLIVKKRAQFIISAVKWFVVRAGGQMRSLPVVHTLQLLLPFDCSWRWSHVLCFFLLRKSLCVTSVRRFSFWQIKHFEYQ